MEQLTIPNMPPNLRKKLTKEQIRSLVKALAPTFHMALEAQKKT